MDKKIIVFTTIIGTFVGGYVPNLWNAGFLSMSGIIFSAIGGIVGIWVGYQINQ